MQISILIPAYNAENKLEKCLESIVGQTVKNHEVLIIDDGSVDSTWKIIKKYCDKYSYIKGKRQENVGVSQTRQNLLQMASCDYIMFCDADDYIEENTIEEISKILKMTDADTIIFGYNLVKTNYTRSVSRRRLKEGTYEKKEWGRYHIRGNQDLYWSALWNKCYKRSVIEFPNKLQFQEQLEDVIFNAEFFGRCKKIFVLESVLYNYVQIGESLTRNKHSHLDSAKNIEDAFYTYNYLYEALKKTYPEFYKQIAYQMYKRLNLLLKRASLLEKFDIDYIRLSEFYLGVSRGCGVLRYGTGIEFLINQLKKSIKYILVRLRSRYAE